MKDPLQEVLAAEAAARERIDAARADYEEQLRGARTDATRIRERNERRTRDAIQRAERRCIAETLRDIDRLDNRTTEALAFDEASMDAVLEELVTREVEAIWPG